MSFTIFFFFEFFAASAHLFVWRPSATYKIGGGGQAVEKKHLGDVQTGRKCKPCECFCQLWWADHFPFWMPSHSVSVGLGRSLSAPTDACSSSASCPVLYHSEQQCQHWWLWGFSDFENTCWSGLPKVPKDGSWTAGLKGAPRNLGWYFSQEYNEAPVSGVSVMTWSYHRGVEVVQLPVFTWASVLP